MSAAKRGGGVAPDMTTEEGRSGLTQRRRERGLPTGRAWPCGFCGEAVPLTLTHCHVCGAYLRSSGEARPR